ncbi:hypothetical protein GCM10022215_24000 [Nocardioides fonticola]|uniref:Uncharacterized protein n=1 Tax=Nocardioides fonticola TaxID=450363 RepID=A0ABP7XJP7_9ACTN
MTTTAHSRSLRNPLSGPVRFGLYAASGALGVIGTAWVTRDVGATIIATQTWVAGLAVGKVDLSS